MSGGGDARNAVNVGADVAFRCQERRSGVEADADLDPAGAQPLDDRARRLERAGGRGEREEERIALSVDLGSALLRA